MVNPEFRTEREIRLKIRTALEEIGIEGECGCCSCDAEIDGHDVTIAEEELWEVFREELEKCKK